MTSTYNTNLPFVAAKYVEYLNVPITKTTVKKAIEENPFFPSLYSLSDTYERLRIENKAFKIDIGRLHELQPPFITFLNGNLVKRDFVLVTEMTERYIKYVTHDSWPITVKIEDFKKDWNGLVFLAEGSSKSIENDYSEKRKREVRQRNRQRLLFAGGLILIIFLMVNLLDGVVNVIPALVIMLTKFTGVFVTILLLVYDAGNAGAFVKNLCGISRQTSCEAVLKSKGSSILGISWSEVGFLYFTSTMLFLFFPGITLAEKMSWLSVAGVAASGYIFFSIYYQWNVVRRWCTLCMVIQFILLVEALLSLDHLFNHRPVFSISLLGPVIVCALIPLLAYFSLKPILNKQMETSPYEAAYKRLIHNPGIFRSLLEQQVSAPPGWDHIGIEIGNPEAKIAIIKVCNPYCSPCAKAHPKLEEIISTNENVKLRIIFISRNQRDDPGYTVVSHLMAMAEQKDLHLTKRALDEWYSMEKKDYQEFAGKFSVLPETLRYDKADEMRKWCEEAGITHTPTFFINGKLLPEKYGIDELIHVL